MKLRKITSLVIAAAMAMSTAAMLSLPAALAATDEETLTFTENFDDMELTDIKDVGSKKATLDTLIADGWLPVDNNKAYANYDTSKETLQFVAVEGDATNKYLRLITPKTGPATNTETEERYRQKYGLGRLFPGQGTSAKGVWEICFRFKPQVKGASMPAQFNFSMNTYGADIDETIAQHNIVSAYNKMYLGYRDYMALYNNPGVPQGEVRGAEIGLEWYDVKVIVNCDERYYSVELSYDDKLVARRSAISFAGDETIGFFKMSALGVGKDAEVLVDDITIKPAERETLIYNEDFEAFSGVQLVTDGITTGGETEDVSGHSYFGGFTPWRAHKEVGNYYDLEIDPDLLSQVVRLGSDTVGSGLVYMPALEKLVDTATQSARGMVKLSFKIKPDNIDASSVTVNAIADHTQSFNDNRAKVFMISKRDDGPALATGGDNYAKLDPSHWYDVDLVFDVINKKVTADVTDIDTSETVSYSRNSVLTAVKGIMFTVPAGSSVLADDINIEYYMPAPEIDEDAIVLTDQSDNAVADKDNAPVNIKSIKIPVGCMVNPMTASAETIKLTDGEGTEIPYDPSRLDNAYTLILKETLEKDKTYTVTVPSTLANIFGEELGEAFTFTFSTNSDTPAPASGLMNIRTVQIAGEDIKSLSDITAGSTLSIITDKPGEVTVGTGMVVFYKNDGELDKLITEDAYMVPDTDDPAFTINVPQELDMGSIGKVSIFIWNGLDGMEPYCLKKSF